MKIALEDIDTDAFDVRDEIDPDHVSQIAESLKNDGQWNPVIVRPSEDGLYEMIAGHTRYKAAKEIGWDELEATVKNISKEEAEKLALKTNIKRKGMTKIEEGKIVNKMLQDQDLSQSELADKLGKSQRWVSERVKVALELAPEVKGLVEEDEISYNIARIVTQVDEEDQLELAKLFIDQNITDAAEASKVKNRFLNDTIFTTGYEGEDFTGFVDKLSNSEIDVLVDVRGSNSSTYKPEFSGDVLENRLQEHDIEYVHLPELGVDYLVRNPYKEGHINHECFKSWYQWWVNEESGIDIEEFAQDLNERGKAALMCIEKHPTPKGDQDIYCHRHHLSEMVQSVEESGRAIFPKREDI